MSNAVYIRVLFPSSTYIEAQRNDQARSYVEKDCPGQQLDIRLERPGRDHGEHPLETCIGE